MSETRWRILLPGDRYFGLVLGTDASGVVELVEDAMERHGIDYEREGDDGRRP